MNETAPPSTPPPPSEVAAWGAARTGAVAFAIAFPIAVVVVAFVLAYCWSPRPCRTYSIRWFWLFASLQATTIGFLFALWAHWVPCAWLSCDLKEHDAAIERGIVLFATWPVFAALLLLPCAFNAQYGLAIYRPWPGAGPGEGPGLFRGERPFMTETVEI